MQKRFYELDGERFIIVSADGFGGKTTQEQADLTLARIREDLEKSGSCFDNIMRITVYMKNREMWDAVREARQRLFPKESRPASASIFVGGFRPEEALVAIEATALANPKSVPKRAIEFDPPRLYLKALVADRFAFLSGTGGEGQTEEEQAVACFKTLSSYLEELRGSVQHLRRVAIYLKQMDAMEKIIRVVHRFFGRNKLCWEVIPATGFAREEMLLEIDGTAIVRRAP